MVEAGNEIPSTTSPRLPPPPSPSSSSPGNADEQPGSGDGGHVDNDVDDDVGDDEFPGHLRREKRKFCAEKSKCGEFEGVERGGGGRVPSPGWPATLPPARPQAAHTFHVQGPKRRKKIKTIKH